MLRTTLVLAAVTVVVSLGLPQQQARLSGSILGDIGAGIESAVSGIVGAVQGLLGFSGSAPATSGTTPDLADPFELQSLGEQADWQCTNCPDLSEPLDESRLAGGQITLACTQDGMPCTEDGADTEGYVLLCIKGDEESIGACAYDYEDDVSLLGDFGDECDADNPCDVDWECNFEGQCVDPDS